LSKIECQSTTFLFLFFARLTQPGREGLFKGILLSRDGQAGAALLFGGPFLISDLSLCVAADTLLLPMTVHQQVLFKAMTR
jgi:hypothetical protein